MRRVRGKICLMICVLMMFVLPCTLHAQYDPFVSEDFRGSTAPDWTFVRASGTGPILTGNGTIDPEGDGWLRLTANEMFANSFVYYNDSVPTRFGLVFSFDFVIWKSNTGTRADGLALVIFDADADPIEAGGWGGSLGYAPHNTYETGGLNGGIVGFGFDTFGNYSNPTEGRSGGPGQRPHSIAIRGSMGDTRYLGYEYVTGAYGLPVFSTAGAASRASATVYSVEIIISTDKKVTIKWKPAGDSWSTLIDQYECTLTCPDYIRFGYTASTGSYYSYHEIRNFEVRPLEDPTLIELSSFEAGWQPEGIAVSWVTEAEIDNAYFDLYRAASKKKSKKGFRSNSKKGLKMGPYVKINASPIPAEGIAPFGTTYEYLDTDVEYGRRYWYKLQDVDVFGTATQHGPCGPVSAWEDCSYQP